VRHRLRIVDKDDPPAAPPQFHRLVVTEVSVLQLEASERQRRCQVVSAILLRLAESEAAWADDEAA